MTQTEPVVAGGAIVGLLQAVLALLLAFGVDITKPEIAAIQGVVVAIGVVVTFLVRQSVTPVAKTPPAPATKASKAASQAGQVAIGFSLRLLFAIVGVLAGVYVLFQANGSRALVATGVGLIAVAVGLVVP